MTVYSELLNRLKASYAKNALVAQRTERPVPNRKVAGSIPAEVTRSDEVAAVILAYKRAQKAAQMRRYRAKKAGK